MLYGFAQKNKGDWWTLSSPAWRHENIGVTICAMCEFVLAKTFPKPIDIRLRHLPKQRTIGVTSQCSIGVMRLDLYHLLRPHLTRVAVGKCLDEDGALIPTHVSFYTDRNIVVRGGYLSEWRQCGACNKIYYLPKGRTRRYILRHYITGQDVYLDDGNSIFISEKLYQQLDWTPFRDYELYPLPVLDTPIDEKVLPGDPPEWGSIVVPDHLRR